MKEKINIGIVGYGCRGKSLMVDVILHLYNEGVIVKAVCDTYEDRMFEAVNDVEATTGVKPFCSTDYRDITTMDGLDAVVVTASWEAHVPVILSAMKNGKYVATEVGGSYSINDCWEIVRTSEQTGIPCMMLENCCYGRREMMLMNMLDKGFLGQISHCSGGYMHDLRSEISHGKENRHYRLRNYLRRNCENYPTHELGPIAMLLDINYGNRMLSLTSTSSCAHGLNEFVKNEKGGDHPLAKVNFAQGDIVTTVIKCARGETITLTLDTTLPRAYSRGITVRGTKAAYFEDTDSVFVDGVHNKFDFDWSPQWGNAKNYEDEYDHPLWAEYKNNPTGGHGGMDGLVLKAFFESVKNGTQTPIDVYDTASLMCISALSEESISTGSSPVAIPDFTNGAWIEREPPVESKYCLRKICRDKFYNQ
ncbi:MAG: gfo/Idh/MocA family oxidoreductase [Clostridiales bacterium]|nr:gfo/Idh/MocA family oxidoreductase [Clostridiales bacterium]